MTAHAPPSASSPPTSSGVPASTATRSLRPAPLKASAGERVAAGLVAAGCLAMLVVGATLDASPLGHGTHEGLGLPPCGWAAAFDAPCPTCGMTTAVTHAVHGRPLDALHAQPFGAFVALAAAIIFWIALHTAATGSRLAHAALDLLRPRLLWILLALAMASWAYKWATWISPLPPTTP